MNAIANWFLAKDWRTWLSHVLMAVALAVLTTSAWAAMWVYLWREIEQVWVESREHGWAVVEEHALDHFMDFAAPFAVLVALVSFGVLT